MASAAVSAIAALPAGAQSIAAMRPTAQATANQANRPAINALSNDTLTSVAAWVAATRELSPGAALAEIKRLNPRTAAAFADDQAFGAEHSIFINSNFFLRNAGALKPSVSPANTPTVAKSLPIATDKRPSSASDTPATAIPQPTALRGSVDSLDLAAAVALHQNATGSDAAADAKPLPTPAPVTGPVSVSADAASQPAVSSVQSLTRLQAEQERLRALQLGRPPAYVDKVMDPSTVPAQADASSDKLDLTDAGLRTYFVETRMGFADSATTNQGSARAAEFGVRSEYRYETLNYGELVAQVDARTRAGDQVGVGSISSATLKTSERVTLRDIGLPITSNVFADIALGDISSEVTDALGRNYRLSLGSSTLRGASAQIFSQSIDLRLGVGLRGDMTGTPYAGFERSEGTLGWLGYTQRFDNKIFTGVQIAAAKKVATSLAQVAPIASVTSVAASVGRGYADSDDGDIKVRATALASRASTTEPENKASSKGLFVEGGFARGGYKNEFGAYWSEPDLFFGDSALNSDSRGAYWRVDRNSARLQWGASLDFEQQNLSNKPGLLAANQYGISANGLYRLDRDSSVGANLTLTESKVRDSAAALAAGSGSGSRAYNFSASYQTRFDNWGSSRITVSAKRNQIIVANAVPATGEQVEWEHDWITGKHETMRPEFTTTLGVARDHSVAAQTETSPTAAIRFRYWPDADWNFGGNLRYTALTGNLSTSRGLSGSIDSEYVIGGGWRLGFAASINQANVQIKSQGSFGGITTGPIVNRSNDKSAYIYIRFDGSRGSPYQTLGLKSLESAGAGNIRGVVYFDGNRDGQQQSDERGVPGVEVSLDGRYRTTTNAEGRFEFPIVATGGHRLTLKLETVPLPWGAALETGLSIEVPLRGTVEARIPVVRVGD